jgi:macrolide transport system ATP-binding/permease protein
MRGLRALWIRLWGVFDSERQEREIVAELESHLQMHIEDNLRSGMTPEQARRDANLKLGGLEQTKQAYREQQGLPWVETLRQDIRFGLRMIRKSPGLTSVAVLALALGIGANTTIFTLLDALYLKPLAVSRPEQLVRIYAKGPSGHYGAGFSYPEFTQLRDHNSSFAALCAETQIAQLHFVTDKDSEEVRGSFVSANYFTLLGIPPRLGRSFLPEEDRAPSRDPVAVISDRIWKAHFNSDPTAIGREIHVNGVPFNVIGIAPPGFHGDLTGFPVEVWLPAMMLGATGFGCEGGSYDCSLFDAVIGRLAPGPSATRAQAEASSLIVWSATNWPERPSRRQLVITSASAGAPDVQADSLAQMHVLMSVTATLLLIVCANLAGLFLARGVTRRKEIAIRLSIGAKPFRIIRQLLTESSLLAFLGGALGLRFSFWAKDLLSKFYATDSEGFHHLYDLSFDWRVLIYSLSSALITGICFGLIPAIRASRQDLITELKEGASAERHTGGWLRHGLVIGQVALSMILVVSAGLLTRSGLEVQKGTNFDPAHTLVLRLRPELIKYTPQQVGSLIRRIEQRLSAAPGVQSVAFIEGGEGLVWNWRDGREVRVGLPGTSQAALGAGLMVRKQDVDPNFFQTLRISLLQGRAFREQDHLGSPRVAIVNQALAERLWSVGSAVGRTALISGEPVQIIGVSGDTQPRSPMHAPEPHLYLSYWQSDATREGDIRMAIRVAGEPALVLPAIRRTIQSLDPNVPIGEEMSMSEQVELEYMPVLLAGTVTSYCGLLALCLSAMGLYSVLAFAVRTRTREIGIRMALGALPKDVFRVVVGQGTKLILAGVVIGVCAALALTRLVAGLLFGVKTNDPATYTCVALLLFLVAIAACYLPARRATRVDPMQALRTE